MWLAIPVLVLFASVASAKEPASTGKFRVEGETLFYNTESSSAGEMEDEDVQELLGILRRNAAIAKINLNSSGGSLWAAEEMARIVIDFELDTEVVGVCSSACATLFLAGGTRTMARGAKIGFHRSTWAPERVEQYYLEEREREGWETPFEFGAWIYEETQEEVYQELAYLLSRGVTAEFAIRTKEYSSDMWYPTRKELRDGGVLRE